MLGVAAADPPVAGWPQFRGPDGSGVAVAALPPVKPDGGKPTWRTELSPGKSSPVLWGDQLFVTGVEAGRLVTLALDAETGAVRWKKAAPEVSLESVHAANSAAASTPCVDALGVCVYFGSYGLLAYDHAGRELWRRAIPTPKSMYGVATSPILDGNRLLLLLDDDENLPGSKLSRSKLAAFDRTTGAPVWETARPYNRGAWSSPVLWRQEQGAELVVLGDGRVAGYDPATGTEKWYVGGFAREPIALPVVGDGLLYVSVSLQGGRGDAELDVEPFWQAMLQFDRNGDGRIGRDEITPQFTQPIRPELAPGHPGFGLPLDADPVKRAKRQQEIFDRLDKNHDGFISKEEYTSQLSPGRGSPRLVAIRPGGSGDAAKSRIAWEIHQGIPEITSPVFHAGRLYLVRDGGTLTCVDAATGAIRYRERLNAPGQYSASPVIARDQLYLLSAKGVLTVVPAGDHFAIAHQTDLGAPVVATPAFDARTLYVRTETTVLAFR